MVNPVGEMHGLCVRKGKGGILFLPKFEGNLAVLRALLALPIQKIVECVHQTELPVASQQTNTPGTDTHATTGIKLPLVSQLIQSDLSVDTRSDGIARQVMEQHNDLAQSDDWHPPKDFIGSKEITTKHHVPRSTLQGWAEADNPDKRKDPKTSERTTI